MPDKEQDLTQNSDVLNSQNTMTGSLTTNPDGTVKDPFAAVDDNGVLDNSQYATQPNTSTTPDKSATGSGLSAADGANYSWNTKAEERSELEYKSAVLESKANYLTNRQEIETQGQQLQQQMDMQKYSQNQSNEKAGWTGGYILDTERQMAYLKQTIQSQMYGQMELQKYGYDTSLAAARLAYDTNKYDLALEYYQKAIENALGEAEITGYYVSPEVSEHLDQYSIASKNLNSGKGTERDEQIVDAITKWFNSNGISKQGVETLVRQEYISTLKKAAQTMANFQENSDLFKIDLNSFGEVDANGKLIYSEGYENVNTIHFDKMSKEKIIEYANRGETAKQQVMGYMDGLIEEDIQKYLDTVKKTTGEKGKEETTYDISISTFTAYLNENSGQIINTLLENSKDIFKDYSLKTELNKHIVYINIKDNKVSISLNQKDSEQTTTNVSPQSSDLYIYEKDPTTNAYKPVAYNPDNLTGLKEDIKKEYGHGTLDKIIDLYQPQSVWGDDLKQEDVDKTTFKGEASNYITAIIKDAKEGKIPLGSLIQFNYGWVNSENDTHNYIYIGKGKFIKAEEQHWGNQTYMPEGYKKGFLNTPEKNL